MNRQRIKMQLQLDELVQQIAGKFSRGEEGQDMIEYALLAALISIVAIIIILAIGGPLQNLFQNVVNQLTNA